MCDWGRGSTRVEGGILRTEAGKVDYRADFFGKPAFLTVSGQLNAEYCACALSNVYTFGPTFPRREQPHRAPPGRVPHDRAGDGVLHAGGRHAVR